jgi:hypothetical protein
MNRPCVKLEPVGSRRQSAPRRSQDSRYGYWLLTPFNPSIHFRGSTAGEGRGSIAHRPTIRLKRLRCEAVSKASRTCRIRLSRTRVRTSASPYMGPDSDDCPMEWMPAA